MNFLQRLFTQPRVESPAQSPADESHNNAAAQPEPDPKALINHLPPGLYAGKLSDIGQVRERNEDSFYVFESLMQHNDGQELFGLFMVADGMGGHQQGEVASALAIRTAAAHLLQDVYLPYLDSTSRNVANRPLNEALVAAVESANVQVQKETPEGGTTLTAALVMGNSAYIAHVGDSRAYLFNQDGAKQITKDHSYVQRLVELGQETAESALVHPQRNVLYRALGQGGTTDVDTYVQYLPPGSSLLLCSDGLWGLVDDKTMHQLVVTSASPQEACERLVAAANERGGEDNITAVMVTVGVENQASG